MNIEFRPIDKSNYNECIELSLNEAQAKYVAPNYFSLVQAAYEPNLYPLGIYSDNKMVGFILYDFDEELNGWSMSRFMIDANEQNKGIGKMALHKFLDFFTNKYGHLQLYTSTSVDNPIAISLYEKFGFEKKEVFEYEAGGNRYKEYRMIKQL
ncbi:GNAT family N-acetyltransferase [Bacillus sp. JJ1764]|uniref:GNAT family N-acetyltransferase n=1 Tax=Bacillus sp. JJ1764 TaxID=3122964 RepID=UPI003000CAAB